MTILKKHTKKLEKAYVRLIKLCKEAPYFPRWVIFMSDLFIAFGAFMITYFLCDNLLDQPVITEEFEKKALLYILLTASFFYIFKTYKGIIRYSTYRDALRLFISLFLSNLLLFIINKIVLHFHHILLFYGEIGFLINFTLAFVAIFSLRMFIKVFYDYTRSSSTSSQKKIPMFMYGISTTTIELAKVIMMSPHLPYKLVGFLASDSNAADKTLLNILIHYENDDLGKLLTDKKIRALMINPAELDRSVKQKINDHCLRYNIELLSAPSLSDIQNKPKSLKEVKKIRIEELLGRVPIEIDVSSIKESLEGQCVLVTGAAGSIGSELVRQISKFNPGLLLLCDSAETPTHLLRLELMEEFPHLNFCPIISDIRNYQRMEVIFKKYRPKFVYHAAAYKHVPLMEEHPTEAILTNVLGTKNISDLSILYQAEVFVMISTDKAVNPTNVMGASKRIAEIYVQSASQEMQMRNESGSFNVYKTRIITTRFGNVLGSSGSVIPRFQEQIEKGGPVTVTHKDIIRYFMMIPEACRLVLEAGNMGKGGEIFVFDMGDPVSILDLAERMILLSGYSPDVDIDIKFTGLRPGEKLYEELLNDKEQIKPTHNRKIMIGKVIEQDFPKVITQIQSLIAAAENFDDEETIKIMKEIVPEFISLNP